MLGHEPLVQRSPIRGGNAGLQLQARRQPRCSSNRRPGPRNPPHCIPQSATRRSNGSSLPQMRGRMALRSELAPPRRGIRGVAVQTGHHLQRLRLKAKSSARTLPDWAETHPFRKSRDQPGTGPGLLIGSEGTAGRLLGYDGLEASCSACGAVVSTATASACASTTAWRFTRLLRLPRRISNTRWSEGGRHAHLPPVRVEAHARNPGEWANSGEDVSAFLDHDGR